FPTMASSSPMFVYVLRCRDGSYYVGHTADLVARLRAHNEGRGARFTAARRPVQIVYAEQRPSAAAAIHRERQLKGWSAAKKEALIAARKRRHNLFDESHQSRHRPEFSKYHPPA